MTTEGPVNPATLVDNSSVGADIWANPTNAAASDNVYAHVSGGFQERSHYLQATNFDFSAIPSDATIDGVEVFIERKTPYTFRVSDYVVKLVVGGVVVGDNKAVSWWGTTETTITYGGAADLWGLSPTRAQIVSSDFGVVISVNVAEEDDAIIDHIAITVHYTPAGGGSGGGSTTVERKFPRGIGRGLARGKA